MSKSPGERFNDALNAHFGTNHPSNQWARLGPERQARFELAAQTFLSSEVRPVSPSEASAGKRDGDRTLDEPLSSTPDQYEGGNASLFPQFAEPLRGHLIYLDAALSTYGGTAASQDVAHAWQEVIRALPRHRTSSDGEGA